MRFKRSMLIIIMLCISITTTGCWDSKDLNEKALLTMVVTDRQDDEFILHVEMPSLEKNVGQSSEGSSEGQYTFTTGRGKRISDARWSLESKIDKITYLGTVRTLVLTDDLIKEDFILYMNRMESYPEYRKNLKIVVFFENPEDLLSVELDNNQSIGQTIADLLKSSEETGLCISYTPVEIFEFLDSKSCFVLPNIGIEEGDLSITGYSIIHKGKYLESIPLEESVGLLFMLSDNVIWPTAVMLDDVLVGTKVTLESREITPIYENGRVTFDINFQCSSEIMYLSQIKRLDETLIAEIRQDLQKNIWAEITSAIEFSQNVGCDYLGLENEFRIKYPNEVKQLDWQSTYQAATVNITVNTTLESEGGHDFEAPIPE